MRELLTILIISSFTLSCCSQAEYYQEINHEQLDAVIALINVEYKTDKQFLEKLDISQRAWQKATLSDLDLVYPEPDKSEYGSVYPICQQKYLDSEINKRILFLEQWINGVQEGELCTGSILINSEFIDTTFIKKEDKLNGILKRDTIVFNDKYSMQDFVNFIDIRKGILKLQGLPSGRLVHYNPIELNKFENDISEVSSGVYMMDLRYDFDPKPYKRIYKAIRVIRK